MTAIQQIDIGIKYRTAPRSKFKYVLGILGDVWHAREHGYGQGVQCVGCTALKTEYLRFLKNFAYLLVIVLMAYTIIWRP